eukprot:360216-Pelagomonas_calceolata.AAC.8
MGCGTRPPRAATESAHHKARLSAADLRPAGVLSPSLLLILLLLLLVEVVLVVLAVVAVAVVFTSEREPEGSCIKGADACKQDQGKERAT